MTIELDFDASAFQQALVVFDQELDRRAKTSLHFVIDRAVNEAKAAAPPSKTGALASSIQRGETEGELSSGNLESSFAAGVTYASYVEEGTPKHPIVPRYRKMLRFAKAGFVGPMLPSSMNVKKGRGRKAKYLSSSGYTFSRGVEHPGTQPHPFMGPAKEHADAALAKELDTSVMMAARKAGLK